jgi:hypothetical protein
MVTLSGNRSLLLELTTQREGDIKKAIRKCLIVRMSYDDKKGGKGKRERYILPVVYGRTKNGKLAIRAFQTAGSTKRCVPKYKLFLLNNIYSWSNGKRTFYDYESQLLQNGLNEYGDMSFSEIYAITPFAKGYNQLSNEDEPIDSEPLRKDEIPPEIGGKKEKGKTSTPKRTRSKPKGQKTVDISKTDNYPVNKLNAPKTEPVTKAEIDQTNTGEENPSQQVQTPNGTPQQIDKNNILTQSYKDMMDRMDNLYKDDEDEDDENNIE